jgi:hypothetical protein
MGAREASGFKRMRVGAGIGVAALVALFLAACGEDDFPNEPRPPAPISVTAKVDSKRVVVSPKSFGAGLVDFTVSNQSDDPVRLTLVGPEPDDNASSAEIPPDGGVGDLKAELVEGDYEVNAGDRSSARPASLEVGPQRESSQNDLLLP